jgi:putative DNA methylase
MSNGDDRRLIEDYLPIEAISAEASREKSVRKGHISTLHLWWARRPLVACRAAVYGALVPASLFRPANGPEEKRESLARANAAKFIERLCQYPGSPQVIAEAQRHILEAHAERLTQENGKPVTVEDIVEARAPRPKVLDMFAGGGAIPLEALRLGCEAYALDLNPVAHIIELCTLVYPQKYGKPDPNARGMTGPKNSKGETTWGGLADEVRYWGNWVLKQVKTEIGDLYPLIPDPEFKGKKTALQTDWFNENATDDVPPGYLMPVAYLWTRTVTCKNPTCKATVPLLRQTWLCKKTGRYAALKMIAPRGKKQVRFEVVETHSENGLGFDPAGFSTRGNATCPFCGTVADSAYVKAEGRAARMGQQMMAVVSTRPGRQGKVYLSATDVPEQAPDDAAIGARIEALCRRTGLTVPSEKIEGRMTGGICLPYGLTDFGALFTPRQMRCLLTFAAAVQKAEGELERGGVEGERAKAVATYLGVLVNRQADYNSSLARWLVTRELIAGTFGRQALPMVWDFAELAPFGGASGSPEGALDWIVGVAEAQADSGHPAIVSRGSATALPWPDASFDAVITDPPYYDNVDYAKLSDFFYVWLRRTVGHLYPEHFATEGTPKKQEAVADAVRHGGSKEKARAAYEQMMADSFREAHRLLKSDGQMTVVYAHKTTLGWSTLVDALRGAGFTVTEAWPLDTERPGRLIAQDSAALASSILLVARKREGAETGSYEDEVRPELERIVRERVDTLWKMGITGADLVIAAVGAGLRAFTRFARVEYANGEEVPAGRFLTEVETVVLETILARLSKEVGGNGGKYSLAGLDPATRFYVLWRYTYKAADLDAGEAIIFANGTHVELDGANGLSSGTRALVAKNKSKYRLLDYTERGDDAKLGLPSEDGQSAPLVDALHRLLWLMERHPSGISEFLREARPNTEQMRLVAQALAGPALKGGELGEVATGSELAALTKLTANWRSVVEDAAGPAEGPLFRAARRQGQEKL